MPELTGGQRRSAGPGYVFGAGRGRWRCLLCEADGGNGQPEWVASAAPSWDQYAHYVQWHMQAGDVRR